MRSGLALYGMLPLFHRFDRGPHDASHCVELRVPAAFGIPVYLASTSCATIRTCSQTKWTSSWAESASECVRSVLLALLRACARPRGTQRVHQSGLQAASASPAPSKCAGSRTRHSAPNACRASRSRQMLHANCSHPCAEQRGRCAPFHLHRLSEHPAASWNLHSTPPSATVAQAMAQPAAQPAAQPVAQPAAQPAMNVGRGTAKQARRALLKVGGGGERRGV